MAKPFWEIVNEVIAKSDIILEVLDARYPEETRNREIEDKARKAGKKLLYVLNKCDLAEEVGMARMKAGLKPSIVVSATKHLGTAMLHKAIARMAEGKKVTVGVVGYPNTGKSSVINVLKGRASASSSPQSGHTKAEQLVRISRSVYLIDTPGVYPYLEKDEIKHSLAGTVDFSKVNDPEDVALRLIEENPGALAAHYGVARQDADEILSSIALKLNMLKKGSKPDTKAAARAILLDLQRGKLTLKAQP